MLDFFQFLKLMAMTGLTNSQGDILSTSSAEETFPTWQIPAQQNHQLAKYWHFCCFLASMYKLIGGSCQHGMLPVTDCSFQHLLQWLMTETSSWRWCYLCAFAKLCQKAIILLRSVKLLKKYFFMICIKYIFIEAFQ